MDRPSPTGDLVELDVDKVVAEGDGLARRDDGKVVFVKGGLPGERIRARVVAESKDYERAVAVEIIQANEARVAPPCRHVSHGCGGCDMQHASRELQLRIKQDIVRESLQRIGRIQGTRIETFPSTVDELAKLRTTVRVASNGDHIGFRRASSHEVVPIDTCMTAHPRINDVISALRLSAGAEAVIRVSHATSETLVWCEPSDALLERGGDEHVGPRSFIHEDVAGVRLQVSAPSFFQSSPGSAHDIIEAVQRAVGPAEMWPRGSIIDAYGGIGLFATTVVPGDRHVVVVESNESSCADARVNLKDREASIVSSRVEDWTPERAAIVIADPARDGLKARATEILTACEPSIFVLVSCDAASLGRDARLLAAQGYRLTSSEVLDVFPHTHHVEVVSRFERMEM